MMLRILAVLSLATLAVAACHSGGQSYNPPNDPMMGDYRTEPRSAWRNAPIESTCASRANPNPDCVMATYLRSAIGVGQGPAWAGPFFVGLTLGGMGLQNQDEAGCPGASTRNKEIPWTIG
jgi:hypothetical protein